MSFKDFRVVEAIGKGSFASVYKVIRKSDNKIYALKRVKINKMSKKEIADALNEIRFLASIRQKNIVGFLEAFLESDETELCIVMEYCGCGDLAQKVERYKRRRQYIDENVIWRYLVQCLKALQHLHEKGICHRDLKAANTFLAEDGSIKIGDMNVSKRLQKGQLQTQIGTPYYMGPEIWNNRPYDSSADIWALGCMIYELAALRPPFTGNSFPELKRNILSGRYPAIPGKYSHALTKVIGSMLKLSPKERPSASAMLISSDLHAKLQLDEAAPMAFAAKPQPAELIDTIKVPIHGNLKRLGPSLPKPCYPDARPNSPTAWTVAEQQKVKQQPAHGVQPPPPPNTGIAETASVCSDASGAVGASRVPLSSIPENQQRAGVAPTAAQKPVMKAPMPARRVPAPPPPPQSSVAPAAPVPVLSQVPGAYNRGRYIPSAAAGGAAGYPSRIVQRRIW